MSNIQLRSYQIDSIQSLMDGFMNGHKRQILSASTGAGKSIIAMKILEEEAKKKRVMFVCDRRVLVDQFSLHLSRHGIDHGCVMAGHWRHRPYERIQIASIQTLERKRHWPDAELIIVDEIHAVMRKSLKDYMEKNPQIEIIGLTATPFHPDLGKYFTSVTNVVTMEKLVEDKYLVPFKVFVATEIDTKGVKVVAGEWQKDEIEERGLKIVGDVVAEYVKLSQTVFGGYKKTICFSAGVAHGKALAKQFASVGLNFVPISYLDSEEHKQEVLKIFADPMSEINGVISSDILTRGFDQQDVEHVIVARPLRKSFSMHVQMLGRGARSYPGKNFCVIQDHSGNWLRFADDFNNLFTEGAKKLSSDVDSKPRKEPTEKEKKEAKCPMCKALWVWPTDTCGECGHIRQRLSAVHNVAGKMEELDFKGKKEFDKQEFYSELLYYARSRGYNEGWAAHKYKERVGTFPNGLQKTSKMPSIATSNWIKNRMVAYAKSKAKNSSSYRNLSVLR